ncbi:hypothetical protein MMPV_007209 [Pyropia vietnamensis]
MPLATQTSTKADATLTAVIFLKAVARTTFEKRSVNTKTYRFLALDVSKGPRMSMLTSVNCSDAGNNRIGVVWRRKASRLCAHAAHCVTTPYASVAIDGQ